MTDLPATERPPALRLGGTLDLAQPAAGARGQRRRRGHERGGHAAGRERPPCERPRPGRRHPVPADAAGPGRRAGDRRGGARRPGAARGGRGGGGVDGHARRRSRRGRGRADRGVPVLHRAGALAALCARRTTVAVAGTHGKTTTSALLATILAGTGRDPGWVVGVADPAAGAQRGVGRRRPAGGRGGRERRHVPRPRGRPGASSPTSSPTTSRTGVARPRCGPAFRDFVAGAPRPRRAVRRRPRRPRRWRSTPATTSPTGSTRRPTTGSSTPGPWSTGVAFDLRHGDERVRVELPSAPGVHNARNAAGALAVAHRLGVPLAEGGRGAGGVPGRGPPVRAAAARPPA